MIYLAKAIVCGAIIKQSCVMSDDGRDFLNTSLSMCEKKSIFYRGDEQFNASRIGDLYIRMLHYKGYLLPFFSVSPRALGIGIAHPLR